MEARETILARYSKIEREPDEFGRMIGVKRLRPDERLKVRVMADSDDPEVLGQLVVAAAVREIDQGSGASPMSFPRNRPELDAILNALDDEGLMAAIRAYGRLQTDAAPAGGDLEEAAKN